MEQSCSISMFVSKFDNHIPYVNESKLFREFLDRTIKFAIGFGALNDGAILAPYAG